MTRIAVPVAGGEFCSHFGGADGFLIFEPRGEKRDDLAERRVPAPSHERGAFPELLRSLGVSVVLAGGMGPRAQQIFQTCGIDLVLGVEGTPRALAEAYLRGELASQGSSCEGHRLHRCHDHGD